ncbi:MAG: HEPN domain-containing protein [Desulfobaccales bacterium]
MNATIKEWLDKAEKDFATACRESAAADEPNYDAVCFHAQQCVEKLMKACLIYLGVIPPKTHDLAFLHKLLVPFSPSVSWPVEELRFLTRAAVAFRYPGEAAELEDAEQALAIASRLRLRFLAELEEKSKLEED